jgi:hypothetical protein
MINLIDAIYVYMTTEFDAELATHDPPTFAVAPEGTDEDLVEMLAQAGARAAQRHDKYQTIKHISTRTHDQTYHQVLVRNAEEAQYVNTKLRPKPSVLNTYSDESALVADFWQGMLDETTSAVLGWRTRDMWGLLVNKALRYEVPIPARFKQDLSRRYCTLDCLIDLRNIYLQGCSPAVRNVPDIADVFSYWDLLDVDDSEFLQDEEILTAGVAKWRDPAFMRRVELYLEGMDAAVRRYYRGDDGHENMRSMLGATATSIRGPQPSN